MYSLIFSVMGLLNTLGFIYAGYTEDLHKMVFFGFVMVVFFVISLREKESTNV